VTLTCLLGLLEKHLLKARSLGQRLAVCLEDSFITCDVATATGMRMTCLPPPYPKVNSHPVHNIHLVKIFLVDRFGCETGSVARKGRI
jgi:hypothetical protein